MISDFDSNKLPLLSVSHLCKKIESLCRTEFPLVRLRAEVSTFVQAHSGHCYFNLRENSAQIRCVMFKSIAEIKDDLPKDGKTIEVIGTIAVYETRGDLQFNVLSWRTLGISERYEQFVKLKNKLAKEGLFANERKRYIRRVPEQIAVITSLKSAALQDVLTTLQRRAPYVRILVVGSQVQGESAPFNLMLALNYVYSLTHLDTLLLVRGGGTDEDLYTFNDENLVRLLAQSPIPVVTGIGHEIDFTLCDFVADLRSATPTAAAEECALPIDQLEEDWRNKVIEVRETMASYFNLQHQRLDGAEKFLNRKNIFSERQRLMIAQKINKLSRILDKLLAKVQHKHINCQQVTRHIMTGYFRTLWQQFEDLEARLESLDPFKNLKLRNAILRLGNNELLYSVSQIKENDTLRATLNDGEVILKVSQVLDT